MRVASWECAVGIPGQTAREELQWLAKLARGSDSWTELGAFCGRSMLAVGLSLRNGALLQIVDHRLGDWMRRGITLWDTYAELTQQRPDLRITLHRGNSAESALRLARTRVVFVDAAHDYESVLADVAAWKDRCRILCGHDYDRDDVQRAVAVHCSDVTTPVGRLWMASRE